MQATEVLMPGDRGERVRLGPDSAPDHPRRGPLGDPTLRIAAAIAGAAVALVADAAPTGDGRIDAMWRLAAAFVVVIGAAWAPAWTWVVAASGATLAAGSLPLLVVGGAATAISVIAFRTGTRHAGAGSVVAVLVFTVAANLPTDAPLGVPTAIALAICSPLVIGGGTSGPWQWALVLRGAVVAAVVGAIVAAAAVGWAARSARSDLIIGSDATRDALVSLRSGDRDSARASLDEAIVAFDRAERSATNVWLRPASGIPVIAQHLHALENITTVGTDGLRSAADVVEVLADAELTTPDGAVDLRSIEELLPLVGRLADDLRHADDVLDATLGGPWLLPPVRSAMEEGLADLDDGVTGLERAARSLQIAPALLGDAAPQTHLVIFWTPSEARGAGGLFANWAVLVADAGRLSLRTSGRFEEIADALAGTEHELSGPPDYVARYAGYDLVAEPHDIGVSPDMPAVAAVAADLIGTASNLSFDSVITIDPRAIGAVLAATGPVEVDGVRLDAENAERFLLVDQYERWIDDEDARVDFLDALTVEAVSRLIGGEVDPLDLVERLRPLVADDRVTINATDPDLARSLAEIGVTGAFPESSGDLAGFVIQNGGRNKIDAFVDRSFDHHVDLDPATGAYEAVSTVTLTNTAPDAGLAPAIIGSNDQGLPLGTSRSLVTIHSPLVLQELRVNGRPHPVEAVAEFGVRAYSTLVDVPAGATTEITAFLSGVMPAGAGEMELVVPLQPGASDTRVSLSLTVPSGWFVEGATTWRDTTTTSADQRHVLEITRD